MLASFGLKQPSSKTHGVQESGPCKLKESSSVVVDSLGSVWNSFMKDRGYHSKLVIAITRTGDDASRSKISVEGVCRSVLCVLTIRD
ncbi:hypothetical protein CDL15_Pgr013273 [Punica granatum]|nr:hypothetical protein CDL15_Pgr013273 [Punica granatum]